MFTPPSTAGKWTERTNAQPALNGQDAAMYRILFETSTAGILVLDPRTRRFIDCNPAAVRMCRGGDRAWLLSQSLESFLPAPNDRDNLSTLNDLIAAALDQGTQQAEFTLRGFNGETFPAEVTFNPVEIEGQTLLVTVCRDVSRSRKAEAALHENQQLLCSIVDNISEAVYRTGPDHQLIFANRAYLRMSGYESLAEMQSMPRERLYARAEDRARLLYLLQNEGGFKNEEIEYINRAGKHWWGLSNGLAVRDPQSGRILYHVGSVADITERKQAEAKILQLNASLERRIEARTAELRASEARLRTMIENAPEAIVVFNGDNGQFLYGNTPAGRLLGRSPESLTGLGPADVSPAHQRDGRPSEVVAREKMNEALAGGAPVFDWLHQHSSGRVIATEVRLVRLPSERGRLLRASIFDTTERDRREKVQQATFEISEAVHTAVDLQRLFERIHEIVKGLMPADNFYIAIADPDGSKITFPYLRDESGVTSAPLKMGEGLTGYVLNTGKALLAGPHNTVNPQAGRGVEVVMDGARKIMAVDYGSAAAKVWLGAPLASRNRAFGVVAVQDYHHPHAYGEPEKQILSFVAGQIALAIERKQAEQALKASEEKFRALFEASSQGVVLHDERQYLSVNPAAARIMGYPNPEQLVGMHPRDTSPPFQPGGESSATLSQKYIERCLREGHARFDWVALSAQKQEIPVEVILTRVEWAGRQIIQAVINDISERKKAEAELLRALAREKELGQLKSNFVSMVSHEFRNPLGVILSSAEILDHYLEQLEPAERREQLDSIQKNSRRMAALMEEVLLLGMVESGKMDFKPVPLDLAILSRRLAQESVAVMKEKCQISFRAEGEDMNAAADERLLQHILSNLLINAVKYSEPKQEVDFTLTVVPGEAVWRVRDRGVGIPEADQRWLFNPFHRGRNVGHVPGTGLGLTIVKRCVELHGGKIELNSAVGQGTTVTVRLPLFPVAAN